MPALLAAISWLIAWVCTVGVLTALFWAAWWALPGELPVPSLVTEAMAYLGGHAEWNPGDPYVIRLPPPPHLTSMLRAAGMWSLAPLVLAWMAYALTPLSWRIRSLSPAIKLKTDTFVRSELHTVARLAGMRAPAAWGLMTHAPNAMAISAPFGRRAVAVTEGLLRVCTRDELRWVLAHELGHLHHGDGAGNGLWIVASQWAAFARRVRAHVLGLLLRITAVLPFFRFAVPLLAWLFYSLILLLDVVEHTAARVLRLLSRAASRHAEFRADQFAARLLGPEPGISVLKKLGGGGTALPDLFSTHPSVHRRIERLSQFDTRTGI